ncbi:sentrin-specific protease-like [Uloborus diversus]|uniref:sentrin-specific protease-like n=1 Tax=Uloborus diversus TaxID=327109 RepID=UPI00240A11FE|nr:sentrin-specific protease-like [Uloborus diversus]
MYSKSKMHREKDEETCQIPDPASCIGNPFTAFEVIRLQEKKQYQELLDKYMKNQFYQPLKKTTVVDVEPESSNELLNLEHCNKEVLQQPLDSYLQQYYEPFKISEESSEKDQEQQMPEVQVTEDEVLEIDDDISILKVSLPKFKLKYDHKPNFADPKWLSQLQFQVRAQAEERQKIEADQLKILQKLRRDRLSKQIITAIEPRKEQARKSIEIPEITPEMNATIERALCQPMDYKVAQSKNASLMKRDIETLVGLNWLNDEVINYYLSLIVERSETNKNYPKVYAYNTFFYSTLKNKGYSSVKRWTRRVDIFSYDMLLVPLHLDIHWALAVIYPAKKKIEYYDSMSSGELSCFTVLSDYIVSELKDKKGLIETSEYHLEKMNAPIQMNGSDCGMFTLKYAEYITRNASMNFDQANIPYFRRRMIYELLTNTLL